MTNPQLNRSNSSNKNETAFQPGRRFCIIRQGALGDFILTLPLISALSEIGEISLICRRDYLCLVPDTTKIASWLDVDSSEMSMLYSGSSQSNELGRMLCGAQVHIFARLDSELALAIKNAGASDIVWHNPKPQGKISAARQFLLEAGVTPRCDLEESSLLQRGGSSSAQRVWIHSGSGSKSKNIPPERWREIIGENELGHSPIISFGEADMGLLHSFKEFFGDFEPVVMPSLAELKRLLAEEAAKYYGADTGVTHLAAALGIPTTAVFISTDATIWHPCGKAVRILMPEW